jgi:DivIVA domain-containing protein
MSSADLVQVNGRGLSFHWLTQSRMSRSRAWRSSQATTPRRTPTSSGVTVASTLTVWCMVADRNTPVSPGSADRPETAEGATDAGFPVVRRGYDPDAVEAYLRRLDAQLEILVADRDAAVEQSRQMGVELEACRGRVERLRGQVNALSEPGLVIDTADERVRSMLRLVEDDIHELPSRILAQGPNDSGDDVTGRMVAVCAESMRAAARAAAAAVETERDRVAAEFATTRREDAARNTAAMAAVAAERSRVLAELETARRVHAEQIEQATAAAEATAEAERARAWADSQAQCVQAWTDAQARCAQVERDFRLALDSRRSEAIALLSSEREQNRRMNEELHAAAVQEARRITEDARTTTRQVLEQGRHEITLLRRHREELVTQLNAAHQELQRVVSGLVPPRPE